MSAVPIKEEAMKNQTLKLPDPTVPLHDQPHDILLAMLLFGEARGQDNNCRLAVANIVRNRVLAGRYGGNTWPGVILQPKQFSCFNPQDVNRPKLLKPLDWAKPEVWGECLDIAQTILYGTAHDNTKRSTHYHDKSMDFRPPFWAKVYTHTLDIGDLRFYRDPLAFKDDFPEHAGPVERMGES